MFFCCSSVSIPKDISYFRVEREQILQKGLEVSGVQPILSQADVMQKELEICRSREYTLESLPLLLHQLQFSSYLPLMVVDGKLAQISDSAPRLEDSLARYLLPLVF
ncbi:hypothetical protein SKAU_G00208420 [Synaphobranchus kaupii]|uniref:DUF4549 domain-containing protein n=1 Tax=Synaphobranchus kaupii TaxID=118154 RepID=A0A9Q1F8J4_SYNKA|nr:hypothetical protein SKAU_G00208420 [Synaphobranchus kaupii]